MLPELIVISIAPFDFGVFKRMSGDWNTIESDAVCKSIIRS